MNSNELMMMMTTMVMVMVMVMVVVMMLLLLLMMGDLSLIYKVGHLCGVKMLAGWRIRDC